MQLSPECVYASRRDNFRWLSLQMVGWTSMSWLLRRGRSGSLTDFSGCCMSKVSKVEIS